MSVFTLYQLTCTQCGREYKELFDDINDISVYPPREGWVKRIVPNGSEWDFCPKCLEKYEEEKDEEEENNK